MTRLALFDRFPAARILHEDADIVVIDKPCGLATHAPEPHRADDVVSWLKQHYEARGVSSYLGIHQRLDRDTSGVLLFARRKEANAALAPQFEKHQVEKVYTAVVEGKVPARAELAHYIAEGDGGLRIARVRRGPARRGEQEALTTLSSVARKGTRALVELTPKTGRTHQLRVQMKALEAPIVGDVDYGGRPRERMMLHAERLTLRHPSSGERVTFLAPHPPLFEAALEGRATTRPRSVTDLAAALIAAAERRFGIVAKGDTTAYRLVHGEGDGLPGITVDMYERSAVLSVYDDELEPSELDAIVDALAAVGVEQTYVKFRPKHASRIVDSRRLEIAPALPLRGEPRKEAFEVVEHGVPFEVHLGDGLSTGLFLDQRDNRIRIRELATGKRFLNLFAYTGSFSVVAALGGATASTTVDVSRTVLEWATRNLERVGADTQAHVVKELDVFTFLERARERGDKWDLVVLDPPSFSTTKQATFSAESDLARLLELTLKVIAPGGRLLACTNHRAIVMAKLRRHVHEAARAASITLAQVKSLPPPVDFPPPPGREPHLKSVLVTVAG